MEKFLVSQRSSDDRFMGGLYTEIVINNYRSLIHDEETFEIFAGMAKI